MRIEVYEGNGEHKEFNTLKEVLNYIKKQVGFFAYLKAKKQFLKRNKFVLLEKLIETDFGFGAGMTCYKNYAIYIV